MKQQASTPNAAPALNPIVLHELLDELERRAEPHSLTVLYEGRPVLCGAWAPFTADDPQMMHSLSKIGTSLCVGFAVTEGKLRLEDKALNYLRGDLPDRYDPALEDLTIYHLLTMQAGSPSCCNNVWFTALESHWQTAWLREPKLREDIGHVFHYDSGCSYTLSRIVSKVMSKNCLALMQERVFDKMGLSPVHWLASPEGHSTGGWGMYLTADKIAALAQLLVQRGCWNGEQLVPASWIDEMGKPRVAIPGAEGLALSHYAYHLKAGPELFAAEGAFGQYLISFRHLPFAVGITAGTPNYVAADICLHYLKRALAEPCPADERQQAEQRLNARLAGLRLPLPGGTAQPAAAAARLLGRWIVFSENPRGIDAVQLLADEDGVLTLRLTIRGEEKLCRAGYRRWVRNTLYPGDFRQESHCIAYAFDGDALRLSVGLIETSYREEYCLRAADNGLACSWQPNVTYLPAVPDGVWRFTGRFVAAPL